MDLMKGHTLLKADGSKVEAEKALEAASIKELEAQVNYCYCKNICFVVHTSIFKTR